MTEVISQEAHTLYDELNAHHVQGDGYGHEWLDFEAVEVIEAAMQSLINSTIERCAAVADGELVHIFEDTPDETDAICNATVREIARGIRQMKGSTNV